jgi:hypothetical protein
MLKTTKSTISKLALSLLTVSVLAACGSDNNSTSAAAGGAGSGSGSGSGAGSGSGSGGSATVPAAATGALVSNQATATDLVAAVNSGVATIRATDALKSAPTSVQISDLPTGIVTTINCAQLASFGQNICTGSYTIDTNVTGALVSGSTITITYNNVKYTALASLGDITYNGTIKTTYDRYVSPSDFAVTTTYTGLTLGGTSGGPLNGTSTCDVKAGVTTCGYNVGDAFVSNYSVNTSGTTTTVSRGLVRANYTGANGYVDCTYSDWSYNSATSFASAGGVVTVTGINGTVAKITSNGGGKYTVEITVGGTKTTYNVG